MGGCLVFLALVKAVEEIEGKLGSLKVVVGTVIGEIEKTMTCD